MFSQVSTGTIEVSVSASGKVVPAFEEIINSPINTRILEVYKKGGDSVDIGTPILKLDLQSAETDYKQKLDEEQMRSYKLKQLKLENMTAERPGDENKGLRHAVEPQESGTAQRAILTASVRALPTKCVRRS